MVSATVFNALGAGHEPQSPDEWEQWFTATRKALRRQALTPRGGGPTVNTAISYTPAAIDAN